MYIITYIYIYTYNIQPAGAGPTRRPWAAGRAHGQIQGAGGIHMCLKRN